MNGPVGRLVENEGLVTRASVPVALTSTAPRRLTFLVRHCGVIETVRGIGYRLAP
jgi:hypothetical protein